MAECKKKTREAAGKRKQYCCIDSDAPVSEYKYGELVAIRKKQFLSQFSVISN